MAAADPEGVMVALGPLAEVLAADGFSVAVDVDGDDVVVAVEATDAACADCLVPRELATAMVSDALTASGLHPGPGRLRLRYPGDAP